LHLYEIWVVKYIAGVDWADIPRPDFFAKVDAEGMLGWVDNYCRAHPINNVQRAAEQLVIELIVRTMLPKFAAVSPVTSIKSAETWLAVGLRTPEGEPIPPTRWRSCVATWSVDGSEW
jgi:hypothetical protein